MRPRSMAWIKSRYIFCLFLLTFQVCSLTGKGCKKGFAKHRFKSVVSPQLLKGDDVLKVTFHYCNLGKHIKLSTNDDNFGIQSNGKVFATRTQSIHSTYRFKVLAKDLTSHEKWNVTVHLVSSANRPNLVLRKHAVPVLHFQKHSNLRRQKREWIIPPTSVMENDPFMNNPVAIVISDIQAYESLTYTISGPGVDQPPIGLFVVDPKTGCLNITGQVDREKNPEFKLTAQALDKLGQPREKPLELVIEVGDMNDNAPVFQQQVFMGGVEELCTFGTVVQNLTIVATDADIGNNARIAYSIQSQGGMNMFETFGNGMVRTIATNLDRETKDLYTLVVKGQDLNGNYKGLASTANVQIHILDVNDNIPTLEKYEYEVSVQENTVSDEVTRIQVIDMDQEYTDNWLGNFEIIEGNEGGHFRFVMDEKTNEGILVLQKVKLQIIHEL